MIGEDSLSLPLLLLPPSLGRLTETAEGVKNSPPQRTTPPGDPRSTHSVSCLQELQSTLR